ncbi:MAG: hypothetical protein JNJ54_00870 [Myxococcaceae bacterium]|nr:hypothetical protein [Myxococcaceae bacterium]
MALRDELEAEAKRELGRRAAEEKSVPVRFEGGLGGSPVPPLEQLRAAAVVLIHEVVPDNDGALRKVFEQDLRSDDQLLGALAGGLPIWTAAELRAHLLQALATLAKRTLSTEAALHEFTRRVDAVWGQLLGERPHFETPGHAAHPDDPYTFASVRGALEAVINANP